MTEGTTARERFAADADRRTVADLRAAGGLTWSLFPDRIGAFVAEADFGTAPVVRDALREAVDAERFGSLPPVRHRRDGRGLRRLVRRPVRLGPAGRAGAPGGRRDGRVPRHRPAPHRPGVDDRAADAGLHAVHRRTRHAGPRYTPPEGTYLAWLDCRGLGLGDHPGEHVARSGVALTDGPACGRAGAGFARYTLATPRPVLRDTVRRLAAAVPPG